MVVECLALNPCWVLLTGKERVRKGRISFSRILAAGQRREMGRKDLPWTAGLPALRIGMMMAVFQMEGMVAELMERLKMSVRYEMPEGPRFLRCSMVRESGPAAVEPLAPLMASPTLLTEKGLKFGSSRLGSQRSIGYSIFNLYKS